MPYNDTSTKTGLLQDCEFWTGQGDGTISGNATIKAVFTRLLNLRYARTLANIQTLTGKDGAEDTNYADQQFAYFNIVSGTSDYQFLTDEDGNTITDITGVLVKPSGSSDYEPLSRLELSDTNALLVMSPNASNVGAPGGYIEKNNTVYFDRIPDYSATNGGKVFYRLVPSYFVVGDTTKRPGFVEGYHRMLSLGASLDWLVVNKPESSNLVKLVDRELTKMEEELATYIRQKNPTRTVMGTRAHSSR